MRRLAPALLALALLPGPMDAGAATVSLAEWEGVYKDRFKSELVTGESYQAENILEIVSTAPDRVYGTGPDLAYFRLHLDFYNGHICDLWGIARLSGDTLTYTSKEDHDDAPPCVLSLRRQGAKIALADKGSCRTWHCGARGSFDGIDFARSARRPIRYLPKLKASQEYKQALDERR